MKKTKLYTKDNLIIILQELHGLEKTDEDIKRKLMDRAIRTLGDSFPVDYCSKEAKKTSSKLQIDKNGKYPSLKDVCKGAKTRKETGISMDHCNPVGEIIYEILNSDSSDIKEIINTKLETCWLTIKENEDLNKGCKTKRPESWEECYKKKGIELHTA